MSNANTSTGNATGNGKLSNFLDSPSALSGDDRVAAQLYARDMIRLFVADVVERIKATRRAKPSDTNQKIVALLVVLSDADDPVTTVDALGIAALSDFREFLNTSQKNIAEDFAAERPSEAYQILTDSLDGTAQYLNDLLSGIEASSHSMSTVDYFLQQQSADAASVKAEKKSPAKNGKPENGSEALQGKLNGNGKSDHSFTNPDILKRRAGWRSHLVRAESGEDFGFNLSELFGDAAAAEPQAAPLPTVSSAALKLVLPEPVAPDNDEPEPVEAPPALSPSTLFMRQVATRAKALAADKPPLVFAAFEKLGSTPDVYAFLDRLRFVPDTQDFAAFLNSLDNAPGNGFSDDLLEGVTQHLLSIFEAAVSDSAVASRLEQALSDGAAADADEDPMSVLDRIPSLPIPDEPKMEIKTQAFNDLKNDLEDGLSFGDEPAPDAPDATNVIDQPAPQSASLFSDAPVSAAAAENLRSAFEGFAADVLGETMLLASPTDAGRAAQTMLADLLVQPDLLGTMRSKQIRCLDDFTHFVSEIQTNNLPVETVSANLTDIAHSLIVALEQHYTALAAPPAKTASGEMPAPVLTSEPDLTAATELDEPLLTDLPEELQALQTPDAADSAASLMDDFSDTDFFDLLPPPAAPETGTALKDDRLETKPLEAEPIQSNLTEPEISKPEVAEPETLTPKPLESKPAATALPDLEPLPDLSSLGLDDEPELTDFPLTGNFTEPQPEETGLPLEASVDAGKLPNDQLSIDTEALDASLSDIPTPDGTGLDTALSGTGSDLSLRSAKPADLEATDDDTLSEKPVAKNAFEPDTEDDLAAFFSEAPVENDTAAAVPPVADAEDGLSDELILDESLLLEEDSQPNDQAAKSQALLTDLASKNKSTDASDEMLGDTLLDDSAFLDEHDAPVTPTVADGTQSGAADAAPDGSVSNDEFDAFFNGSSMEPQSASKTPTPQQADTFAETEAFAEQDIFATSAAASDLAALSDDLGSDDLAALDDAFTLDDGSLDDGSLDAVAETATDEPFAGDSDKPKPKDRKPEPPTRQRRFEPNEIQKIFLEEASEYLEKLGQDLLELDKAVGAHEPELVNRVLRSSHTIKGSAAMVSLKNISELAHKMEDTLQVVRDNQLPMQRVLLDVLLQATDTVSAMLGKFQQTGEDGIDGQEKIVETLVDYERQLKEHSKILSGAEVAAVAAEKQAEDASNQESIQKFREKFVSSVAEQTVRIDITTLNNLINLSAELVIARNRLNNELQSVYKNINKFIKERNQLTQFAKKLNTTIQKQTGAKPGSVGTSGNFMAQPSEGILSEFSDTEFDRFNEFDILNRDIKSSMLNFDDSIKELRALTSTLNQNILKVSGIANDLNREIVSMRMVPVKQMFTRFSRSVRDVAKTELKELNFVTEGEDTKLDKTVMEEVIEPVMHLVRNSIGHGIETPDVREASGKSRAGTLTLRAYQKGNQVILEIEDDGAGVNIEKVKAKAVQKGLLTQAESDAMPAGEATELIFRPGFSTAEKVTELQGRGVGMDVVRSTIRRLKGTVTLETSRGRGTKFVISLPLTLAIGNALLTECLSFTYAVPLDIVLETANIATETIEQDGDQRFITIRGERIQLYYLNDILGYESDAMLFRAKLPIVVVEVDDNRKVAVAVERLIGKEEIVVKNLGKHLRNVRGVVGSTILGDGQVVIILDLNYLLKSDKAREQDIYVKIESTEAAVEVEGDLSLPTATRRKRKGQKITVLSADDSPSVRKYIQSVLQQADINVISADDGLNALSKLASSNADIVVTDLEMPRMNGFELVSEIRKLPQYNDLPIVIVTARAGEKHRRTGIELGANAFLNKPFDPRQLIETVESFVS